MYKTLKIDAFRKKLGLTDDYKVDGLLASGVWDLYAENRHVPYLRNALETLGVATTVTRIDGDELGHAFTFDVDNKHYWFVPVMGTPYMSQYAHIACLLGSKKNILVGVVGGLKKGIKPADFIIPTVSKGNQSAFMYDRSADDLMFYPDASLSSRLKRRLGNVPTYNGPTITCEVMFAETLEDIQEWSDQGYLGVEMEAALIFALSKHFNVPATALLTVSDNLIEKITYFDDAHQNSLEARENARKHRYEVALAELLDLPIKG